MEPDIDLDRRVAEIVGWELFPADEWFANAPHPYPSKSIADAIAALEAWKEGGGPREYRIRSWWSGGYEVELCWPSEERRKYADTLPLAACRAICATVQS